jgi:ferredoxin
MSQPVCGVCGHECREVFRAPQPEIAPDLDMRPGEPTRSTLRDWVQVCGQCGAAAPDLAALPAAAEAAVKADGYRSLSTSALEETLPFRRWAFICQHLRDAAQQAEALLQAAWAADDAAAMSEAAKLRQEVAVLWSESDDPETGMRRLDVLRRAGAFAEAEAWAEIMTRREPDELARIIIRFQRARIAARDIGRHLISSVLPPPAHAPHVSHAKRATTGFWSRLLRR